MRQFLFVCVCFQVEDVVKSETGDFPNYENIDFLKNDKVFAGDSEKTIEIQKLREEKCLNVDKQPTMITTVDPLTENNLKFPVSLRKTPKNFTRNRLIRETNKKLQEEARKNSEGGKCSNLSLRNMETGGSTLPSIVTEKYVNYQKPKVVTGDVKKKCIGSDVSTSLGLTNQKPEGKC